MKAALDQEIRDQHILSSRDIFCSKVHDAFRALILQNSIEKCLFCKPTNHTARHQKGIQTGFGCGKLLDYGKADNAAATEIVSK